jgi:thiamine monophosphate synthase
MFNFKVQNALESLTAGAAGIAVVSVLFGAADVESATRNLMTKLKGFAC